MTPPNTVYLKNCLIYMAEQLTLFALDRILIQEAWGLYYICLVDFHCQATHEGGEIEGRLCPVEL